MINKETLVILGSGGGTTGYVNGVVMEMGLAPGMQIGGFILGGENIGMLTKAKRLGAPWRVVDEDKFRGDNGEVDRYGFGQALINAARELHATVISQNGWLPYAPANFIDAYRDVIFNQHPGPKNETKATHGIQPHAIMYELAKRTGRNEGTDVIIHRVDEVFDHGETLARSHVNILEEDTPEAIQSQALFHEYLLQVSFWQQFMKGDIKVVGDQVYARPDEQVLLKDIRKDVRKQYPKG